MKCHPQNEIPEIVQVSVMLRNLIIRSSLFFVFLECYKSSFVLGLSLPRNTHLWIFLLVELPKLVSRSSLRPKRDRLGGYFYTCNHFPTYHLTNLARTFSLFPVTQRKGLFLLIISAAFQCSINILLEKKVHVRVALSLRQAGTLHHFTSLVMRSIIFSFSFFLFFGRAAQLVGF